MTLSYGRDLFLTPGPSVMPDSVLAAMMRPAPNIYGGPLVDVTASIVADLKTVAGTAHQATIYIANGHGIWEAAVANVFAPGDAALMLDTGNFAKGWADVARRLGVKVTLLPFGTDKAADPAVLQQALAADTGHHYKAVMCTQTDTSTSASNNIAAIRAAINAANHPALLMVDCVASLGCEHFEMDAWGVDVMVTACQKGLMCPPGLAYMFFNDKAARVARPQAERSPYWDWTARANPQRFYEYFFGTAPTHLLYAQRAALDLIMAEGMPAIWARHHVFASAIWAAVQAWGTGGPLRLNIADPAQRSRAVTTVMAPGADCNALRNWLSDKAGVTLGVPLGFDLPEYAQGANVFRIGHMGHLNPPMVLGGLATLQAGLTACGIPFGAGALDAASAIIAQAG